MAGRENVYQRQISSTARAKGIAGRQSAAAWPQRAELLRHSPRREEDRQPPGPIDQPRGEFARSGKQVPSPASVRCRSSPDDDDAAETQSISRSARKCLPEASGQLEDLGSSPSNIGRTAARKPQCRSDDGHLPRHFHREGDRGERLTTDSGPARQPHEDRVPRQQREPRTRARSTPTLWRRAVQTSAQRFRPRPIRTMARGR